MRMLRTTIEEKYELIRKLSFITENYAINPWQYIKEYIKREDISTKPRKKKQMVSQKSLLLVWQCCNIERRIKYISLLLAFFSDDFNF